MKSFSSVLCCLLLAVSAAGCFVPALPDDTLFSCDTNADCAQEGSVCMPRTGLRGFCCTATAEVCNGKDDDCNGQTDDLATRSCYSGPEGTLGTGQCHEGKVACGVNGQMTCAGEVLPTTEVCNGKDDDCDGQKDEDFNLQTDMANCGTCGRACNAATETCVDGICRSRGETDCGNNIDDDQDGNTDCADLVDCTGKLCGSATCLCINGKPGEGLCSDGADNDKDGDTDCADTDCDNRSCGAGCVCALFVKTESNCSDGVDNDGNQGTDCVDIDCNQKSCGTGCVCLGNAKTESNCADNVDNDGNQGTDCADADCNLKDCSVSGGCTCKFSRPVETNCGDTVDNDGDQQVDCADYDCAYFDFNDGTRCQGGKRVEYNCGDGVDNGGSAGADCNDADCAGMLKSAFQGTICSVSTPGGLDEANCTDGKDNDSDNKTDCKTTGQGADPNCSSGTGSCGFGCVNISCTTKKETVCDDTFDNDGDGNTDCNDSDCNTTAGQCRKVDGTKGTCQTNKACN